MFFERIRKKFSKGSSNQSVTNPVGNIKSNHSPLTNINNGRSTQPIQGQSSNKSFPDNYFDADSLFK